MATRFVTVIACPLTAPMRHPSGEARGALIAWPPLNTSAPLVTATSGGSRRTGRAGQGRLSDSIDYLPLHMWEASPTPRPRSTPNRRGPSRRIGVGDPSHTPSRSRLSPSRRRRRHCNSNPRNHFEFCRQKLASRQNAPRDGLASHSTCGRRLRRRGRAPLPTAAAPSRRIGSETPPTCEPARGRDRQQKQLATRQPWQCRGKGGSEVGVQGSANQPFAFPFQPLASGLSFPPMPPRPRSPTTQMVGTVVSVDSAKAGFGVRGSENPPPTTRPRRRAPEGQQKQLAASAPSQKPALFHPRNT